MTGSLFLRSLTATFFFVFALTAPAAGAFDHAPADPATGLTIPNARFIGSSKKLIRGHAPADKVAELKAAGVTHVLIIKNQVRKEVEKEINELVSLGLPASNIHHIPYRWKEINQLEACAQTVEALEYIRATEAGSPHAKLYLHCTAGIDRTGLVSALYRLQNEPAPGVFEMFKDEMCAHGYGDATYFRPDHVKDAIHTELTPLYIKLAQQIVEGRKTGRALDAKFCQPEVFQSPALEEQVAAELNRYRCRPN